MTATIATPIKIEDHIKALEDATCSLAVWQYLVLRLEAETEVMVAIPPGAKEGKIRLIAGRVRLDGQLPLGYQLEIDGSQAVVGFQSQNATRTVGLEMEDFSSDPAGHGKLVVWNHQESVDVLVRETQKIVGVASGTGIEVGRGGVWRILSGSRP